ncbi:hypothetical protein EYB53_003595 [Candidatus Chloroploca sp. M-50]|uniref:3-keto-disaccharide hydrolase domain-containing protein n=1 Tax=Candidatus Chloroploca mongolica TaxID=2528176 RepID=A0ABS4D5T4_9CHLR|nr:hypothetical protein [Candidatus Chloroploca mongolica]MBP1464788.1 hypothetical protein [Candidatus Chloroploca mongolica]
MIFILLMSLLTTGCSNNGAAQQNITALPTVEATLTPTRLVMTPTIVETPTPTARELMATIQAEEAHMTATNIAAQRQEVAQQVFRDEFADNRNAWFTGVFNEIETNTIEDGFFKIAWTASGASYELFEVRELNNFIAELDCRIHEGHRKGSCSLIFGHQGELGFYKYELFEDYYRLFIIQSNAEPGILAEGDPSSVINPPGELNQLRIIREGNLIQIELNNVMLARVNDNTYPGGKVGVSTNSYSDVDKVEVWLDRFAIWSLPE